MHALHAYAYWGEPERAPQWSNGVPSDVYICIYLSMYRTSFRNCSRVLIHWTASILLSVIQFCKFHYVQIIGTASIFHLQWPTTSMCSLCTLLVQADRVSLNLYLPFNILFCLYVDNLWFIKALSIIENLSCIISFHRYIIYFKKCCVLAKLYRSSVD